QLGRLAGARQAVPVGVEAPRCQGEGKFVVGRFARRPVLARQESRFAVGCRKAAIEVAPLRSRMRYIRAWPLQVLLAAQSIGGEAGHVALAAGRRTSELVP